MAKVSAPTYTFKLCASPKPGMFIPIDNLEEFDTQKVDVKEFLSSPVSQNFEWIADKDPAYTLNDVVTYQGNWYQSLIVDNATIPGTDPLTWNPLPKAPSGLVPWQAGVYPQDLPMVYHNLGTLDEPIVRMYVLASNTRPYVSTDLITEIAAGDWKQFPDPAPPSIDLGPYVYETDGDGVTDTFPVVGYIVSRVVTVFLDGVQQRLGVGYTVPSIGVVGIPTPPGAGVRVAIMFMGALNPSGDFVFYDTGEPVFEDDDITEVEYV